MPSWPAPARAPTRWQRGIVALAGPAVYDPRHRLDGPHRGHPLGDPSSLRSGVPAAAVGPGGRGGAGAASPRSARRAGGPAVARWRIRSGGFAGGGSAGGASRRLRRRRRSVAVAAAPAVAAACSTAAPERRPDRRPRADASRYTWVAAAIGSNEAAGYQLATGQPVMAIGGFNGTDPSPTLAQFERYVQEGKIHYFIAGGGGGSEGRRRERDVVLADHHLGRDPLHRQDGGRRTGLRPHARPIDQEPDQDQSLYGRGVPGQAQATGPTVITAWGACGPDDPALIRAANEDRSTDRCGARTSAPLEVLLHR